jgi:hypothetical protein
MGAEAARAKLSDVLTSPLKEKGGVRSVDLSLHKCKSGPKAP